MGEQDYGDRYTVTVEEFKPGDHIEFEVETVVRFQSESNLVFDLVGCMQAALEGSTTTIPYTIVIEDSEKPEAAIEETDWAFNPSSHVLSIWGDGTLDQDTFSALGHNIASKVWYLSIGTGVTTIRENTFSKFENVREIAYLGTWEQWEAIEIGDGNDVLKDGPDDFGTLRISFPVSGQMDKSLIFGYSDQLFSGSSYSFRNDIAKLALGLEMSCWSSQNTEYYYSSDEEVGREQNVRTAFRLLGFDDLLFVNYDAALSHAEDKAAYAIGTKKIQVGGAEQNLVAVMIRGGGYGAEWASNFRVGTGARHQGFSVPAAAVFSTLSDYLKQHGLDNADTRFLISGYSRGSAIGNLLSADLIDSSELGLSPDHIFSYLFATPQGVNRNLTSDAAAERYNCIINIINKHDFVPKVAPSAWGFRRYGRTYQFPGSSSSLALFNSLLGENLTWSHFEDVYQRGVIADALNWLTGMFETPEKYERVLQGAVADIFKILYSGDGNDLRRGFVSLYGQRGEDAYWLVHDHVRKHMENLGAKFADFLLRGAKCQEVYIVLALMHLNGAALDECAAVLEGLIESPDTASVLLSLYGEAGIGIGKKLVQQITGKEDYTILDTLPWSHYGELYLSGVFSGSYTGETALDTPDEPQPPAEETSGAPSEITYLAMAEAAYSDELERFVNKGKLGASVAEISSSDVIVNKTIQESQNVTWGSVYRQCLGSWEVISTRKNEDTGFWACAFQRDDQIVIAYRGSGAITDLHHLAKDWLATDLGMVLVKEGTAQMYQAVKYARDIIDANPGSTVTATGHSLGGGLAILASNATGIRSSAFDCAPVLAAGYYGMWEQMGRAFRGVDKWTYTEYLNEKCPVGGIDKDITNHTLRTSLYDGSDALLGVLGNHETTALLDYDPVRNQFLVSDEISSFRQSSILKVWVDNGLWRDILKAITSFDWIPWEKVFDRSGHLILGTSAGEISGLSGETGKENWDVIYGGNGTDSLFGYQGDDVLVGGKGNDVLDGNQGSDTYLYYKGDGKDTIFDYQGNDKLVLAGFSSGDVISTAQEERYIRVLCNGADILRVSRNRSWVWNNSFELMVLNDEGDTLYSAKLQDWNEWKNVITYRVACPVELRIYDQDDNLVMTLPDQQEFCEHTDFGNFYVSYNTETGSWEKMADLTEGYTVRAVGTGEGSMEVSILRTLEDGTLDLYEKKKVPVAKDQVYLIDASDHTLKPENGTAAVALVHGGDNAITPTWKLTAPSLVMQKKQKTSLLCIYGLAEGDSVAAWKSGNTKIVKVTGKPDGTCTLKAGKKTGKTQITATLASGAGVTFTVKVQKKKVKTNALTLTSPSVLNLKKGQSFRILYSRAPVTAQDKVTFTSRNRKIVSVSKKGVIKARKAGRTTITIRSGRKKKKITCIVTG